MEKNEQIVFEMKKITRKGFDAIVFVIFFSFIAYFNNFKSCLISLLVVRDNTTLILTEFSALICLKNVLLSFLKVFFVFFRLSIHYLETIFKL